MRFFSLISLFLGMVTINSAMAYDCEYMGVDTNKNLSGFVFDGTVLETNEMNKKIQFATFQVNKVWNDSHSYMMDKNKQVEVFEPLQGGGGCPEGYGFEKDKQYLVFARPNGTLLQAQAFGCTCSDSAELNSEQAQKDLKAIKIINNRNAQK